MTNETFEDLGLIEPLLRALKDQKYENPTPIQAQAIPHLLEGKDILGCAQTGTGKTAAFALPMLQQLKTSSPAKNIRSPRALILTPTRELADQICTNIKTYSRYLKLTHTVIYGGVGIGGQIRALTRKIDIVVATPGRLLDLMQQKIINLGEVKFLTLDEADRMLDMGFMPDIKKIVAQVPKERQSLFFSATMPLATRKIASNFLKEPVEITVNPVSSTAEKVEQKVLFVDTKDKEALLLSLLNDNSIARALVFTRTKHKANNVSKKLNQNRVRAEVIHGNKSQAARTLAMRRFSDGKARVLVATDIASRGIDIKGISHVINFEMPMEAESYVHRIGRTARAGSKGIAISFCDGEEKSTLRSIERTTRQSLLIDQDHPFHSEKVATQGPIRKSGGPTRGRKNFGFGNQANRFGGRPPSRSAQRASAGSPRSGRA